MTYYIFVTTVLVFSDQVRIINNSFHGVSNKVQRCALVVMRDFHPHVYKCVCVHAAGNSAYLATFPEIICRNNMFNMLVHVYIRVLELRL